MEHPPMGEQERHQGIDWAQCLSVIRVLLGGAAGILVVLMFLQGTGINPGIIISRFSA